MTLTEFLLARIAEDEADARAMPFEPSWVARPDETGQPIKAGNARIATCAESVMAHIARHDPARVLRECQAKRRIIGRHDVVDAAGGCAFCGEPAPCEHLRILAAIYADHPDYDESWRP